MGTQSDIPITISGYDYVFNRSDSEFGNRWWLPGLDQLQIETGGVSILRADGTAGFFELLDGSFVTPYGSLTELEANTDGTYTLHGHHGEHTLFDSSGRLTRIEDANGNITAYAYSGNRLAQITDPFGRTATYTYGADGKLDTVEDFQGRVFSYVHDTNGLLTSITGPIRTAPDRSPRRRSCSTMIPSRSCSPPSPIPKGTSPRSPTGPISASPRSISPARHSARSAPATPSPWISSSFARMPAP